MLGTWREIEKKWQTRWIQEKFYRASNPGDSHFSSNRPPFYVLDMFPYPSGSGLHVGHALGYIGTDIVARKKWMEGYNVLHPMGWDAFGLPAEQYAIQTGQHPRVTTDKNTAHFRKQLQNLGLAYDWDREIDTSDPEYYRWTQWIFLQMFKKGLVYQKEMMVWWCEDLKTVLANEEVINGRSERGNYPCERRPLKQWVFRITDYAERLLEDLEDLDWPEPIKKMQRDWIGRSVGAMVYFPLDGFSEKIVVFTTRLDTLFGVVALVLAPEHPMVERLIHPDYRQNVHDFRQKVLMKSERDRKAEVGHGNIEGCFIGNYAFHPLTGERLPIFIGNYVLVDYGTGAVMSVPAHDERDYAFWKFARQSLNIELPWRPVVRSVSSQDLSVECFPDDGIVVNSRQFSEMSSAVARERIIEELERIGLGEKKIFYKMRDWIFSRQRYWGEPFPLMFDDKGQIVPVPESELPVKLPDMEDFQPSSDGSAPLARVKDWVVVTDKQGRTYYRVTDTMPGWAGSCWYYLRFMDSHCKTAPFSQEAVNYWKQVDLYVGGASHAVMHLLYARFWHKVLYDLGLVPTKEPFKKLFNQGMVTAFAFRDRTGRLVPSDEVENMNGRYVKKGSGEEVERLIAKMAKSLRNVVNPDEVIERHGCDTLRLYQMFMGPLADDKPWDDEGVVGCENFLRRWWTFLVDEDGSIKCQKEENPLNWKALHKALKRVNESFQNFNFNVAVAAFMEALNDIKKNQQTLSQPQVEFLVKMMHPFAPHLTSEIWERLGHKGWLHLESWPELDENWLKEDQFELVMQINGKTKKKEMVDRSLSQLEIENLVKDRLKNHLSAKEILKIVYVPFKLCNVVVRDK